MGKESDINHADPDRESVRPDHPQAQSGAPDTAYDSRGCVHMEPVPVAVSLSSAAQATARLMADGREIPLALLEALTVEEAGAIGLTSAYLLATIPERTFNLLTDSLDEIRNMYGPEFAEICGLLRTRQPVPDRLWSFIPNQYFDEVVRFNIHSLALAIVGNPKEGELLFPERVTRRRVSVTMEEGAGDADDGSPFVPLVNPDDGDPAD